MSITTRLIAIAALFTAALSANAAVITYTDTVNPEPDISLSSTAAPGTVTSFSFEHNIVDDGFDFATYTLLSANLTVNLYDNVDKGNETFTFILGSGAFAQPENGSNVPNGSSQTPYPFTLQASLGDLGADGKITILLTAVEGNFVFTNSILSARVENNSGPANQVPEPGSLALLAAGFCAVGLRRRKK